MRYVIVGNGVAGIEAAATIRKHDPTGAITVLTDSQYPMYYRPKLIECVSGKASVEDLIFYKREWYQKNRIDVIRNEKVVLIDQVAKKVVTISEKHYGYDKLLLAVGARPFVPPIAGVDKRGVFSLRSATDAKVIYNYCKKCNHVVIIGGGLLGIETANHLLSLVNKVTIVEFSQQLLPKQLDLRGAEILKDALTKQGLAFVLGDSAQAILGDTVAQGVKLKSEKELQADAIIFSIGVRARVELAKQLGLEVNRGIVVDAHLATSAPDIYAAGDVIEFQGRGFGLWMPAKAQGKIAGENMAGHKVEYKPTSLTTRLKVSGISLYSVGQWYDDTAQQLIWQGNDQYRKLVIKNDKLIGAIILNDPKEEQRVVKVLSGKSTLTDLDLKYYTKQAL